MTVASSNHFDVFNFVKKAKEFGINEQFAEYEARQIEYALSTIANEIKSEIKQELHSEELVTKSDLNVTKLELQKEIKNLEVNLEIKIKNLEIKLLTIYGGGFLILIGILAKGFHWL